MKVENICKQMLAVDSIEQVRRHQEAMRRAIEG